MIDLEPLIIIVVLSAIPAGFCGTKTLSDFEPPMTVPPVTV